MKTNHQIFVKNIHTEEKFLVCNVVCLGDAFIILSALNEAKSDGMEYSLKKYTKK